MGVVKPLYIYPLNYVFQEIKNVKANATYGYEALLRPENGMDPRSYINARIAMGGTHQIEIDSFFNATRAFADLHIPGFLFINSFPNESFTGEESISYIESFGKDVLSRVVVEIVEYPFVSKEAWFNKQRFMLKHDMMCALDAFGEGLNTDVNSVLFYGPDIVKISRAIIHDFSEDPQRVEYVKALVSMLKDRDVKVLAEGIENIVEYEMLKEYGIDLAQGYYIGMPGIPDPPPFIEDGDTRKYTDY
ncbi:MAG: EAL domain-containing protein [Lachnospiraceae bacterium]|nr:EAL domain-containing protein [Lachnospiraceae bacterium]